VIEINTGDSNNTNLVTKSNMLIEANYKLGVVEQKIILCLASNIQPTDSDFKTYTLPIKEFHQLLGLKGSPKYSELRQITKELMQKVFEIRIGNKVAQVSWLSFVAYNETEGTIDIRFDPFLRPYLLQLKREFTSYRLENVVKLKSSYAIRIYELLKQYEKLKERTFLLIDLRKMLGAEDVYPAYGNFKQRVLIPAQKELKQKTDISFEFEEVKVGRRVDKVRFFINSKKKDSEEQLSLFENIKKTSEFSEQVKKMALKMGVNLSDKVLNDWQKHGQEKVLSLLEKIQYRKDIENPIGYITTVLNSSPIIDESAKESGFLTHLISYFRKSNELMPDWFILENAVEELQQNFNMNEKEARVKFDEIKMELFNIMGIPIEQREEISYEEFTKEKEKLRKELLEI
jgi:plasmid replication initiation protein